MNDISSRIKIIYHRQSLFKHLKTLKGQLVKSGELVLETLVI